MLSLLGNLNFNVLFPNALHSFWDCLPCFRLWTVCMTSFRETEDAAWPKIRSDSLTNLPTSLYLLRSMLPTSSSLMDAVPSVSVGGYFRCQWLASKLPHSFLKLDFFFLWPVQEKKKSIVVSWYVLDKSWNQKHITVQDWLRSLSLHKQKLLFLSWNITIYMTPNLAISL